MSAFTVKSDCKNYLQGEKSKEDFISYYADKATNWIEKTGEYTKESLQTFLLDTFRTDCKQAFPQFVTDETKAVKDTYTEEQINWLKYYTRRRKTEIALIVGKEKGKAFPFLSLLKVDGVELNNSNPDGWIIGADGNKYLTFVIPKGKF